jgi:hypothetical protein
LYVELCEVEDDDETLLEVWLEVSVLIVSATTGLDTLSLTLFLFFSKNSSISAFITLLLGPVPVILERSMLLVLAILLAKGDAKILFPWFWEWIWFNCTLLLSDFSLDCADATFADTVDSSKEKLLNAATSSWLSTTIAITW